MNFKELNIIEPIVRALDDMKYVEATPIQEKTIPLLMEGKDVMGCAQTGSGKTAAFAVPMLQKLTQNKGEGVRGLIMTPTRELALQIADNMERYAKNLDLTVAAIYGGVEYEEQIEMLSAGVDVIVATPGRLLDLVHQKAVTLNAVEMLVLDEADRMLDMGFIKDITTIIKQCPNERQTIMYSATMPKPIERLADTILRDPETVIQDSVTSTVDTVDQFVYFVDHENKLALLASLIKKEEVKKAIVFTNTRQTAEAVTKCLSKMAVRCRAIHSEKSQNSRQDALIQFAKNHITVLVATDVAARGIDIAKVTHVINYDIPINAESYIHRIGRTGRAGEEGVAINLCCIDQLDDFRQIQRHIKKEIPELQSDWPMQNMKKRENAAKRQPKENAGTFDITKVKDVSLSGKAVKKKSNYQYGSHKFGGGKSGGGSKSSDGSKRYSGSNGKQSQGGQGSRSGKPAGKKSSATNGGKAMNYNKKKSK